MAGNRQRKRPGSGGAADPEVPVKDGMHPPSIPEMVQCIHCGEEYDSWRIEWRVLRDRDGRTHGLWCCPTPGCDGRGFGVDIYPVDFPPDGTWRDEDGRELQMSWEDEEEDEDEVDEDWELEDPDRPAGDPFDDMEDAEDEEDGDVPF